MQISINQLSCQTVSGDGTGQKKLLSRDVATASKEDKTIQGDTWAVQRVLS